MENFDGDEQPPLPSSTVVTCRDVSTPVPVPSSSSSSPQSSGFTPIFFRNSADRRGAILDGDYDDLMPSNVFRLSTDSGMQSAAGDGTDDVGSCCDDDASIDQRRRRHESVGTESGYGSPYCRPPPPAMSEFRRFSFTADSGRNSLVSGFMTSSSRLLIGGGVEQPRWPIYFRHQKMLALGPFDPPPQQQPSSSSATGNSFRSIGSQTDFFVGDRAYVISVEEDEQGIDEDEFSGLDDAFLSDVEEPEISAPRGPQGGGQLPDVVPAGSYDSREDSSWNGGRNRAHSVSFPVSLLDFSQPREVGRYLSRIATDFDQSRLCGRRQKK